MAMQYFIIVIKVKSLVRPPHSEIGIGVKERKLRQLAAGVKFEAF